MPRAGLMARTASATATVVPGPESGFVLREVMESSPIGKALVNSAGLITYANPAFARMYGRTREQCIGLTAEDIVVPVMAEKARRQLRGLVEGETEGYQEERLFVRADGSTFWGLVSASPIRDADATSAGYIVVQIVDIDRQKQAEKALAEAESRWNFALESAGQGVWDHDLRAGTSFYSRMWKVMRGIDADRPFEDSQEAWLERIHPDDRNYAREQERRLVEGEAEYHEFEYRERHRKGHYIWILSRGRPVQWDDDGRITRVIGTDTDVTRIKTTEALIADAFAAMADAVVLFDRDRKLVLCNEQYRQFFPRTRDIRVPGTALEDILRASVAAGEPAGVDPENGEGYVRKTLEMLGRGGEWEFELSDGRWLQSRARRAADDGYLSIVSDITARKQNEIAQVEFNRKLAELARMDGLTGLTNRRAFDEVLAAEFGRSERNGTPLALLLIDVDHFKDYNDSYGHPEGDDCLRAVANVLSRTLSRPGDLAARYGGEEFAAILPETGLEGAVAIAETIRTAVRALAIAHNRVPTSIVTVSVGVAASEPGNPMTTMEALVAEADGALYAAKAAGRDRVMLGRPDGTAGETPAAPLGEGI